MARRPVHIPKTALSERKRASLRASDFAVPSERKYPINDLFHARLALTYVLSPSNAAYRDEVVDAVLARYPELKFWWASRSRALAAPARRKVANPSHTSEAAMPVYTLNPSHKRSGSHKASRSPSLRERVATRRNPEKKHIVLTLHDDRVTWRTSDGRTGSEPKPANFSSGPTTNALLRRLGVIKDGVFQHDAWGIEVLNEDGFPIARFRNPLSEDGVVVSNPATAYNVYLGSKHIDTVFQSGKSDADEVRRSLIDHDGYDHRIRVTKARRNNPRHEVETEAYFAAMEPTRAKYTGRSPEELVLVRSKAAKMLRQYAGKSDREVAKALGLNPRDPNVLYYIASLREHPVVTNPAKRTTKRKGTKRKTTGGRTQAQENAAKAMRLWHSGKASSLAEAWAMLRR